MDDKNGNCNSFDSRAYDAVNQLTRDADYTYAYDREGCLIKKASRTDSSDVTTYEWDVQNRLVAVSGPNGSATFKYDALGRRIAKTEAGTMTRYLYDGDNVRLEAEGGSAWTHAMTSAGTDRWLVRENLSTGEKQYLHGDAVNSTIAVTDAAGSVSERYRYTSFGQVETLSADMQAVKDGPSQPYTTRQDNGSIPRSSSQKRRQQDVE